jgi:hypothetical protein
LDNSGWQIKPEQWGQLPDNHKRFYFSSWRWHNEEAACEVGFDKVIVCIANAS